MRIFLSLLPFIGLAWIFLFLRVFRITDFPLFIDEVHHIHRGRIVWSFSDLQVSTTPSKFLLYYYLGLFDPPYYYPAWIGRVPVALFSLVGAAGTYAMTKYFFNCYAALLSVAVLAFFPFMLFHERMSLTDPFTASIAIVMLWWLLVVARHPSKQNGTILGILMTFMLAGKLLTLPLLAMPVLAIGLFGKRPFRFNEPWRPQFENLWQIYRPTVMRTAVSVAVVWLTIMVFYVGRGLISPDTTNPIVDDYIYASEDRESVLSTNFTHLGEVFVYLWGPLLFVLNIIALLVLLRKRPQTALYLLAGIIPVWFLLTVLAAKPNSRYLTVVGHLWIVGLSGGLVVLQHWLSKFRYINWLSSALVALWIIAAGIPFTLNLADDAASLDLPQMEIRGYFQNLSGYGFNEVYDALEQSPPISQGEDQPLAISVTLLCRYQHYYYEADREFEIRCLPGGSDERVDHLNRLLERYGAYYLIWEHVFELKNQFDPAVVNGHVERLDVYQRPHNGSVVELYRVEAE